MIDVFADVDLRPLVPPPGWTWIDPQYCVRDHRTRGMQPAKQGFSFCWDCLVWLRGESDDDPCDDGEDVAKLQR